MANSLEWVSSSNVMSVEESKILSNERIIAMSVVGTFMFAVIIVVVVMRCRAKPVRHEVELPRMNEVDEDVTIDGGSNAGSHASTGEELSENEEEDKNPSMQYSSDGEEE